MNDRWGRTVLVFDIRDPHFMVPISWSSSTCRRDEQHWKLPNIHENFDLDETCLSLSIESLMPLDSVDELSEQIAESRELPEQQRLILLAVHAGGDVTHPDLVNFVPGHSRDLTLNLQALLRKDFLVRVGSGRGCSYQLPVRTTQDRARDDAQIIQDTTAPSVETLQDTASIGTKASGKRRVSVGKTSGKILDACRERSSITIPELAALIGIFEASCRKRFNWERCRYSSARTQGCCQRTGA